MRVDKAGQDEAAARIDRVGRAGARSGRSGACVAGVDQRRNAAVADHHVGEAAAPEATAVQQQIGHAKAVGGAAWPRQASQTSSIGDIGPQMVVGTFMSFLLAAVW